MAHRKSPKRVKAAKKGWATRRRRARHGRASGTAAPVAGRAAGYKKGKKRAKKRAKRY